MGNIVIGQLESIDPYIFDISTKKGTIIISDHHEGQETNLTNKTLYICSPHNPSQIHQAVKEALDVAINEGRVCFVEGNDSKKNVKAFLDGWSIPYNPEKLTAATNFNEIGLALNSSVEVHCFGDSSSFDKDHQFAIPGLQQIKIGWELN